MMEQLIRVEQFEDSFLLGTQDAQAITCCKVEKTVDIHDNVVELLGAKQQYRKVATIMGQSFYVRLELLVDAVFSKSLARLQAGEIYEHGYPEARLVPANFEEQALDAFREEMHEMLDNLIDDCN